jgi:hypothetical protein
VLRAALAVPRAPDQPRAPETRVIVIEIFNNVLPYSWALGLLLAYLATRSALRRDHPADWTQLKQLSDQGINLEAPREVEFVIFVRTEASARHVATLLANDGFTAAFQQGDVAIPTRGRSAPDPDEGFIVSARKVVILYGDTLKLLRQSLGRIASKENGLYIGWRAIDRSPLGSKAAM